MRILLGLFCVVLMNAVALGQADNKPARIVVMVDWVNNGFHYSVDSKPVTVKDLLNSLGELRKWPGPEPEIILLVHQQVPVAAIVNVTGIAGKAGYSDPRIFVFTSRKDVMNELSLTFSRAIAFSASGNVPAKQ